MYIVHVYFSFFKSVQLYIYDVSNFNSLLSYFLSDNLILYLSKVGEAAPTLPMYYYHIPDMTGVKCKLLGLLRRTKSTKGRERRNKVLFRRSAASLCSPNFDVVILIK